MTRTVILAVCLALSGLVGTVSAGEKRFSWTQAPGAGDFIGVTLNPYHLGKYLSECQVNRPEILNEVRAALAQGKYYRKATKDQKGTPVTLTVNVTPDYMLRIVTWRDEPCAACGGTGKKSMPLDKITKHISAKFNCIECEGKGYLEKQTTEKFFVLSGEDFENPSEGRRIMAQRAFSGAPRGAEEWVERLVSQDPRERLDACLWLDRNYVKLGMEFQRVQPMLRKARYHETNEKKRLMVWQFWAGRGLEGERARMYYRIYADSKTGKITRKGFFTGK